ncbi:MAG TPA: hypothetical protein DCM07_26640 [Planctomycetaceae bacterium]|nr:hypothetical protein [Gimesia sp.]HAH48358.1 hypothetical protein [Planctomycetaceae bacterium]HBL42875.1 hypothetical protein [Planctomycetaceae bacterium]
MVLKRAGLTTDVLIFPGNGFQECLIVNSNLDRITFKHNFLQTIIRGPYAHGDIAGSPILFAKLVEFGTANQSTVFINTLIQTQESMSDLQ